MNEVLPSKVEGKPFRPLGSLVSVDYEQLSKLLSEYTKTLAKYRIRAQSIVSKNTVTATINRKSLSDLFISRSSRFQGIEKEQEAMIDDLSYLVKRFERLIGIGSTYSEKLATNELERLDVDLKLFEAETGLKSCRDFIRKLVVTP